MNRLIQIIENEILDYTIEYYQDLVYVKQYTKFSKLFLKSFNKFMLTLLHVEETFDKDSNLPCLKLIGHFKGFLAINKTLQFYYPEFKKTMRDMLKKGCSKFEAHFISLYRVYLATCLHLKKNVFYSSYYQYIDIIKTIFNY